MLKSANNNSLGFVVLLTAIKTTQALIRLAKIGTDLIRFCDMIGGHLNAASQVSESGFDCAESITVSVCRRVDRCNQADARMRARF